MNREPKERKAHAFTLFLEDKGFYIILFLCVAAIGIAGYVFFAPEQNASQEVAGQTSGIYGVMDRWTTADIPAWDTTAPDDVPAIATTTRKGAAPDTSGKSTTAATTGGGSAASTTAPPSTTKGKSIKAADFFVPPVSGEVINAFSGDELVYDRTMGDWRTHNGTDFAASDGDRVYAIADGVVQYIYSDDYYGTSLLIDHGDGLPSIYMGLASSPAVIIGQQVTAGDAIGSIEGSVLFESAMPVHLHIEVLKNGVRIDPMGVIPS